MVEGSSPSWLIVCPHRLAGPRTPAFHAGDRGSNPLGDAKDPRDTITPGVINKFVVVVQRSKHSIHTVNPIWKPLMEAFALASIPLHDGNKAVHQFRVKNITLHGNQHLQCPLAGIGHTVGTLSGQCIIDIRHADDT